MTCPEREGDTRIRTAGPALWMSGCPGRPAQAANGSGKCLELRMHRDGDRWVADDNGWTMTDYPDYCG